jgi:hypothetical protein
MRMMGIMNYNNQPLMNMEQPLVLDLLAESSYNQWKTGPNAQTDFEPFAPKEQATRNETPRYSIVSGLISGLRMKTK